MAVVVLTVTLGLAYPLAMTGAAQVAFPGRADGSMVESGGKVVGSRLIGQDFSKHPEYFQSRPSVTGYAPDATFFNNQGPNQEELAAQLEKNVKRYLRRERPFTPGLTAAQIPSDAVTSSASGVDPDISDGQRPHPGQPRGARSAGSRSSGCSRSPATTRAGRSSGSRARSPSTCSS